MAEAKIKLFVAEDGVIHWAYPMLGKLTVCGLLATDGRDAFNSAPTCLRCVAMVQVGLEGDLTAWRVNGDPTRKLG